MSRHRLIVAVVVVMGCRGVKTPVGPVAPGERDDECTPDARPQAPGLHPAAGTVLRGTRGTAMRAVITVVAPPAAAVEAVAVAVGGPLPAGMTIRCSTDGCRVAAGARGCVVIAGTPSEAASVTLRVETQAIVAPDAERPPARVDVYRLDVGR